jgi:hypothetical protein
MLALKKAKKKLSSRNRMLPPQQDGRSATPFKGNLIYIINLLIETIIPKKF